MIADGYVWADHFENFGAGNPAVRRTPDFVFARHGQSDVALMESKGTRGATSSAFDPTVRDGYINQIDPHLGHLVGSSTATHGYCIGAWLTSTTKAELNVHYTDVVTVTPSAPTPSGSAAEVQRHNYATAFRLAHSVALSQQIRNGEITQDEVPFFQFEWIGQKWLTSYGVRGFYSTTENATARIGRELEEIELADLRPWPWRVEVAFAIEQSRAVAVLTAISDMSESGLSLDITPMPPDIIQAARDSDAGAAVFPDGLAVSFDGFAARKHFPNFGRFAVWRFEERALRVFE
jgi:hypothetical protein